MIATSLIDARKTLTGKLANCERGAFPGSRERKKEWAAMTALDEFDFFHPEVRLHLLVLARRARKENGYSQNS